MTKHKLGGTTIGPSARHTLNGKQLVERRVTVTCARCPDRFECVITTKPPRYCPECKILADAEKRERDIRRVRTKRIAIATAESSSDNSKRRKLVPYAGYEGKGEYW